MGLANNTTVKVTLPIARNVALFATWTRGDDGFLTATPKMIERVNGQTVMGADRYVYSPATTDELTDL